MTKESNHFNGVFLKTNMFSLFSPSVRPQAGLQAGWSELRLSGLRSHQLVNSTSGFQRPRGSVHQLATRHRPRNSPTTLPLFAVPRRTARDLDEGEAWTKERPLDNMQAQFFGEVKENKMIILKARPKRPNLTLVFKNELHSHWQNIRESWDGFSRN